MRNRRKFLWSSFAFIVVDILFRFFANDITFNWPRIIIDYLIFCVIYFIVSKGIDYYKK